MPLCDGLQATREIREFEQTTLGGAAGSSGGDAARRPLKIIGLTANASEDDRRAQRMIRSPVLSPLSFVPDSDRSVVAASDEASAPIYLTRGTAADPAPQGRLHSCWHGPFS